jgi:alpha-tubulin suppressor-like RCC1 family protein
MSWLRNASSGLRLGDETPTTRLLPVLVPCVTGGRVISAGDLHGLLVRLDGRVLTGVTAVVRGEAFSPALKGDGTVWSWDSNVNGQLSDGTTTQRLRSVPASSLSTVVAIAAGETHALAVLADRACGRGS